MCRAPVAENVPRGSAALTDVEGGDARSNVVARPATLRVVRDGDQRLLDELAVRASLGVSPPLFRVLEDLGDVALRLRRAEYACHASNALGS